MAKILLVEDDNNLREIYEARLQAEGYTIISARDGEEALVFAKNEKPDLVISDVMMPKISGFEMLDILRNTEGLKQVKVIMLTALGQADDQQRASRLGADHYLVKSQVTLEDIVKVAHELLQDEPAPESAPPLAAPEPPPPPAPTPVAPVPAPVVSTPLAVPLEPAYAPSPAPIAPAPPAVPDLVAPAIPIAPAAPAFPPQPISITGFSPAVTVPPVLEVPEPVLAPAPAAAPAVAPESAPPLAAPEPPPPPAPTPVAPVPAPVVSTPLAVPTSSESRPQASPSAESNPVISVASLFADSTNTNYAPSSTSESTPSTNLEMPLAMESAAKSTEESVAHTTAEEEASVEAKIEDFVTGASSDPDVPEGSNINADLIPALDTPSTVGDRENDDKVMENAVNTLVEQSEPKLPSKPMTITSSQGSTFQTAPPVENQSTAIDGVPEPTGKNENVTIAHKKIISPTGTEPKQDLETLLAQEAEKESGSELTQSEVKTANESPSVPNLQSGTVISPPPTVPPPLADAIQVPTPTSENENKVDPNSIAL
jgi:CheY-like chemotaxis protein